MQCILLQTYPHSITDIGNWVNFNEKKIEKKKTDNTYSQHKYKSCAR